MVAPILDQGDIVVMDNLPGHKVAGVREAIEARGANLRYLPPYSPDLNPIENGCASSRPTSARPPHEPSKPSRAAAATALLTFSPTECANFFAHAGYGLD